MMKVVYPGLVLLATATAAMAAGPLGRTFVSSAGLDTNSCARTEPCRSFGAAIAQVQAGGEVIALDSAGYGPVTASMSVSIVAPEGIYAGITVTPGTAGVFVNAGPADVVIVRGLTMNGLGANSTAGIQANAVGTLYVQHTVMQNLEFGIWAVPNANATISVDNCTTINSSESGISINNVTAGQLTRATVTNCRLVDGFNGVDANSRSVVSVEKSVVSGNGNAGFICENGGDVTVDDCVISHNATGVVAFATARVARSLIVKNGVGVQQNTGGSLFTWGDNHVSGNGINGTFPGSILLQ